MPLSIKEVLSHRVAPKEDFVRKFLDNDKTGNLFTTDEVVGACNCSDKVIRRGVTLADYRIQYGRNLYFGKPALIAEFKKAIGVKS